MTSDATPVLPTGCPWCSGAVPAGVLVCPSCGASLGSDEEPTLPGITALDPEAIARARGAGPVRRGRLMSWITGEAGDAEVPASADSLAPPPPEVRREMLRMELEAAVLELQAEAGSLASVARDEGLIADANALETIADDAAAVAADVAGPDDPLGAGDLAPPAEAPPVETAIPPATVVSPPPPTALDDAELDEPAGGTGISA